MEKYGIPKEIMEKYEFFEMGKGVWAFSGGFVSEDKIETVGIRALRIRKLTKPTTAFIRIVGSYATKNIVYLNEDDSLEFLRGKNIPYDDVSLERGFVIVRNREDVLGCGYYTGEKIISEIPKKYRIQNTWV